MEHIIGREGRVIPAWAACWTFRMLFSTWVGRTLHTTSRCSARVSRLHRAEVNNARRIRLTPPPSIFRALGFVGGVSAVTYMGCAAWSVHTNERIASETDASISFSFFLGLRKNYEMLVQLSLIHI